MNILSEVFIETCIMVERSKKEVLKKKKLVLFQSSKRAFLKILRRIIKVFRFIAFKSIPILNFTDLNRQTLPVIKGID